MVAYISPPPKLQFFDTNGDPLVNAKLYTYAAGTNTPLATYTDYGGGTPNTNPVRTDERGECNVWLGSGLYKFVLYTSADALIWTVDYVSGDTSLVTLSGPGGSALVGFIQAGSGAVARTVQAKAREWISLADFGCVLDGVTDDTVNAQKAIDACQAAGWAALLVTGPCLVTTSLNINRLVDTTTSDFHIFCEGPDAGFKTANPINIFSTTLTYVAEPVSERVIFHNAQFTCTNSATAAYVMSQRFLRIDFNNCRFYKIKCVNASGYLQSFHFQNCYANRHTGFFITVATFMFDLKADLNMEGSGIEQGFTAGVFNGAEISGIYEGILGPVLSGPCAGLKWRVRYSEGNTNPDLDLIHGAAISHGIHLEGGVIFLSSANAADPNFYPIKLGDSTGIQVSGTYSGGNLLDDTYVPFGEISGNAFSDNSGNLTKSGRPLIAYAAGGLPRTVSLTAYAGGGYLLATPLSDGLNVISVCATAGDSVGLPTCSTDPVGSQTRFAILWNAGAAAAGVHVSATDVANLGGAVATIDGNNGNTGVSLQPGGVRAFYTVAAGVWRSFVGVPPNLQASTSCADDAAAAAAGVPVGGLYRNGSVVQLRIA